jgi:EAL domain-containing protein (putative c-di-GMP-specific phosphodiesterase class I)
LVKLPIDEVKIDQNFIFSMKDNDASLTMVESIINLCKKMDLTVVAEGVEEKIQLYLLKAFGCEVYQGYYFGKPVSGDKFNFFCKYD